MKPLLYAVVLAFCAVGAGILRTRPMQPLPKTTLRRLREVEHQPTRCTRWETRR